MRKKLLIIFLMAVLVMPLAGCKSRGVAAGVKAGQTEVDINQPPVLTQEQLISQYETGVKAILAPYWQIQDASGIRDKILALRAPGKYTDLHISLVFAFESIEQGKKMSDQSKIDSGADKLNQLKVQYSWLR